MFRLDGTAECISKDNMLNTCKCRACNACIPEHSQSKRLCVLLALCYHPHRVLSSSTCAHTQVSARLHACRRLQASGSRSYFRKSLFPCYSTLSLLPF